MTTNFPSSIDAFTNPTSADTLDNPPHDQQHADINDAMEAVQAKIGVDGSAVTSSLDYRVNALPKGVMAETIRTTSFTASASYQTVMSVSFTADSTRLYRLNFVVSNAMGTPSSRMQMQFIDDLSSIKGRGYHGGVTYGTVLNYVTLANFTTGSRTLNLQAYRDGGTTADFYADTTSPMRLWVEDIGLA